MVKTLKMTVLVKTLKMMAMVKTLKMMAMVKTLKMMANGENDGYRKHNGASEEDNNEVNGDDVAVPIKPQASTKIQVIKTKNG